MNHCNHIGPLRAKKKVDGGNNRNVVSSAHERIKMNWLLNPPVIANVIGRDVTKKA